MSYTAEQKQAWDKLVSLMQEDMVPYIFETWVAPLRLYCVTSEAVVLLAENSIQRDTVRQRYFSKFRKVIKRCFGRDYALEIYTEDEIAEHYVDFTLPALNPNYTFENFVVGPSNRFAYSASLAVAEQPGTAYNPLFIYGNVGLGKTHLMNAIGNFIMETYPDKNVYLTTSESFTNELIDAIVHKKDTSVMRKRMRNVDVLMVDDIQFLARTKQTQEEFFHTFNDLYQSGKQIILSSDRPPKEIPTIEERLRSRFEWGLIVDISKPEYETRVAILNRKAQDEGIELPRDVTEAIAHSVESNIRELEGVLNRLKAQSRLQGIPIDLPLAQEVLSQIFRSQKEKSITPQRVLSVVSEQFGVSAEDLTSKKRSKEIAQARQIAMYLCRKLTTLSTTSIGQALGGRDHTTVMHGCDRTEAQMGEDIAFRQRIDELTERILSG